jgi:hypothetical protein
MGISDVCYGGSINRLLLLSQYPNKTAMSDIRDSFERAADLVRLWGGSSLPDGKTVEELLTIEGISLWSVISPMLAFGHVSQILSKPSRQSNFNNFCRARIREAKRLAFDAAVSIAANKKGCGCWPIQPTFLFLGFSHYIYRETLQPVADRLANRSDCSVTVLDDTFPPRSSKTDQDRLIFQSLWQHWDDDVSRTERTMRNALKAAIKHVAAQAGLPEIIASSGPAWLEVEQVFEWLFNAYLPRLLPQAAIALHIMNRHRPALLISPDVNDPRTRIFSLAGRLAGVRTLEIQFGFYGENDIEWRFFIADRLAVTGESNMEVMAGHGITREIMSVTGSPRYDHALPWPE